jgi:hypothetical protein
LRSDNHEKLAPKSLVDINEPTSLPSWQLLQFSLALLLLRLSIGANSPGLVADQLETKSSVPLDPKACPLFSFSAFQFSAFFRRS